MDFGIALPTPADSWKTVKRAEDAGFSQPPYAQQPYRLKDIQISMISLRICGCASSSNKPPRANKRRS